MDGILEEAVTNTQSASRPARVTVVLADDNPVLLREFRRLLTRDFDIVATAGDGLALLEQYEQLQPEVVVTDISMPVMNGFELAAQLRRIGTAKIVFLTVHEEQAFVEEARHLGALGYVLKRSRPSVLVEAIRSASEGRFFLCPELRDL